LEKIFVLYKVERKTLDKITQRYVTFFIFIQPQVERKLYTKGYMTRNASIWHHNRLLFFLKLRSK